MSTLIAVVFVVIIVVVVVGVKFRIGGGSVSASEPISNTTC